MSANTLLTSVVTGGSNSHATVSEEANAYATDFVTQGVVGAITLNTGSAGTGSYCVNADASPDMGVTIKAGQAYVTATPSGQNSQVLRVRAAADYTTYVINSNASGSTKYDWIYLKIDATKANNPASDASDVASFVTSRSSSNTTDNGSPPTYGLLLAVVTVANAASSITNSNITDKRFNTSIGAQNGSLIVTQSATGTDAIIQAAGVDGNVNLNLKTKGTGVLKINSVQLGTISSSSNLDTRAQTLTASGSATIAYSTNNPTLTLTPGKYLLMAKATARAAISTQDSSFKAVIYNDTGSAEVATQGTNSTGISTTIYPTFTVEAVVTVAASTTYSGRASQTFGTGSTYTFADSSLIAIPLPA